MQAVVIEKTVSVSTSAIPLGDKQIFLGEEKDCVEKGDTDRIWKQLREGNYVVQISKGSVGDRIQLFPKSSSA